MIRCPAVHVGPDPQCAVSPRCPSYFQHGLLPVHLWGLLFSSHELTMNKPDPQLKVFPVRGGVALKHAGLQQNDDNKSETYDC